jgi:hypothetical protein
LSFWQFVNESVQFDGEIDPVFHFGIPRLVSDSTLVCDMGDDDYEKLINIIVPIIKFLFCSINEFMIY